MMFTTCNFLKIWNFLAVIDRFAESELVRYRSHAVKITRTFQQSTKAGDFAHMIKDLLKMLERRKPSEFFIKNPCLLTDCVYCLDYTEWLC